MSRIVSPFVSLQLTKRVPFFFYKKNTFKYVSLKVQITFFIYV